MFEKTIKLVRKNFSFLLISELAIRLLMLILTIYLARIYGTTNYGIYALALSTGNLFEIIFNMGLGTVFMQRISGVKDSAETTHQSPAHLKTHLEEQLAIFLPLRIILSVISFGCFIIFSLALQKSSETFIALNLAGLYFSIFSINTFLWSCFDSRQKMHFTAIAKLILYLIIFGLGLYFIILRTSISLIISTYIVGTIASLIFTISIIHKYFSKIKFHVALPEWKKIIHEGWPIALSGTFVFVYNYLDTILISISKGENAVGLYSVSYKITGTIFILATLINQAYLPTLINTHANEPKQLGNIFNNALKAIFFWSIPITFGGFILAERIILFIFGQDYINSIGPFKILIWNCLIFFFSSALTNLLYALKEQKKVMKIFFAGAVVNTILNIFIIPRYGIEGAAITTILAEIVVLFGTYLIAKKFTQIHIFKNLLPALISSAIMAASLILIKIDSLIITIGIGGLIYFGCYFMLTKINTLIKQNMDQNNENNPDLSPSGEGPSGDIP